MKVLNLRCASGHAFEGWFASESDYQGQQASGLVACPLCDDRTISRLPSAPRLNLSGRREASSTPVMTGAAAAALASVPKEGEADAGMAALQGLWMKAVRHVLAHTEDVGPQFAEEARRIHHGEAKARAIRGQATPDEARALADEGIEVAALPLPEALKGPLQ